jgi:hypothetical protein
LNYISDDLEKFNKDAKRGEIIGYLSGMIVLFMLKTYIVMKKAWGQVVWKSKARSIT